LEQFKKNQVVVQGFSVSVGDLLNLTFSHKMIQAKHLIFMLEVQKN
jgi:hypothetical protein